MTFASTKNFLISALLTEEKLTQIIKDSDDVRGTLTKFMWSNCKACHSKYREEH